MTRIGLIGGRMAGGRKTSRIADISRYYPNLDLKAYPSWVPLFPASPVELAMQVLGYTDAALTAAEDGCDVVIIESIGDYGLAAIRASIPIPVYGPGELGIEAASRNDRPFGIVTVWPESMDFILTEQVKAAQCSSLCVGILNFGVDYKLAKLSVSGQRLKQMPDGQSAIVEKLLTGVAELGAKGAQAVMLGSMCMFEHAQAVEVSTQIPLINPLALAISAAREARPLTQIPSLHPTRARMLRAMVDSVAHAQIED